MTYQLVVKVRVFSYVDTLLWLKVWVFSYVDTLLWLKVWVISYIDTFIVAESLGNFIHRHVIVAEKSG